MLLASRKSFVRVAAAYGSSVLLLGLSDLLLAHLLSDHYFGIYQYVRQLVPLVVVVSLMGIDQVISREFPGELADSKAWQSLVPPLALRASLMALGVATWAVLVQDLPIWAAGALIVAPIALVGSELAAGYLRARGDYPIAAFIQQGYRLLLGLLVIGTLPGAEAVRKVYPGLIVVASVPFVLLGLKLMRRLGQSTNRVDRPLAQRMRRVGLLMALAILTLGALDWVDQASLAARFSSFDPGGAYVSLKVYLSFPFVTLVSILGFAALPEIAKAPERLTVGSLLRVQLVLLAAGVSFGLLLLAVFRVFPDLLPEDAPSSVLLMLVGAGIARLLYVVPSGILGALASRRVLMIFVGTGLVALAIECLVIVHYGGVQTSPLFIGSAGLLIGSVVRVASAGLFAWMELRRRSSSAVAATP